MPKYRVEGKTTVWVTTIVEAEDEEAALDAAYDKEGCLSISADDEIEYDSVTLVEDE